MTEPDKMDNNDSVDDDKPEQTPVVQSRFLRGVLIAVGTLSVALGIIGIFLPILPTTPFLLIAAWCYARSSERFYTWLIANKWFGRYIKDYREGRGIPRNAKILTIALLWVTILVSVILVVSIPMVRIIMIVTAILVTIHIITIKPKK